VVSEYISDEVQRRAGAIVIEQRYVEELLSGIASHGLTVARAASVSGPATQGADEKIGHNGVFDDQSSDTAWWNEQGSGKHVVAALVGLVVLVLVAVAVSSGNGGSSQTPTTDGGYGDNPTGVAFWSDSHANSMLENSDFSTSQGGLGGVNCQGIGDEWNGKHRTFLCKDFSSNAFIATFHATPDGSSIVITAQANA